ncbi:hypothetical protein A3K63_04435 [Candidatus Micrarchaeota archaeon RBG_16_49_10]|nr:MAG: hypothetical protein A3K63_04435 [Candidatus Micrarchaeota archaeon RBG_16_49_10]
MHRAPTISRRDFLRVASLAAAAAGVSLLPGCKKIPEYPTCSYQPKQISFSGYDWLVKCNGERVGPGPNYFSESPENVYVDREGVLRLGVTRRGRAWHTSEVYSPHSLGYGTYTFEVINPPADNNTVLGLFVYEDDFHEIDVELARWGKRDGHNAQFTVQPFDVPGNMNRYEVAPKDVKCGFDWRAKGIDFFLSSGGKEIGWNYRGKSIPEPGMERARMNLWLMGGEPPSKNKEIQVGIRSFSFSP